MASFIPILILILSFHLLFCIVSATDADSLLTLKSTVDPRNSSLQHWPGAAGEFTSDTCNFPGVFCDDGNNVISLNLGDPSTGSPGLFGCITSPAIGNLSLDGFSLSGEIRRGLLRLQFLQRLSLSNKNFIGSISPDFSSLWSLQQIDVSGNGLTGPILMALFGPAE